CRSSASSSLTCCWRRWGWRDRGRLRLGAKPQAAPRPPGIMEPTRHPMNSHLRANLLLLAGTLLTGAVLYPLAVWAVGQVAFPASANGSLVTGPDGKVIGSS